MNQYRTLYKALPFCIEDRESQDILEKENIFKTYTYISNFANAAYCEDNKEFFQAKQKQVINLLYEENCRSFYLGKANEVEINFNPMSSSLYVDIQDKAIYIFANDKDYVDCERIYQRINEELSLQESLEALKAYKVYMFFDSHLLLGGSESTKPYNECFFGTLDSKDSNLGLDILKPIYQLIGETDYDTKDSKESFTQTLQVFLDNSTLTLLNYSLLDSSLNIKLKCNSSESKEIAEREKAQREQQKQQESKTKDSIQSTAMLHPILEDNEIKCPHNGVVKLKSNKGKSFTSKGIPMVLESDLLNAPIIGCTNNIAGIPTPCTSVSVILPSSRGLKKFNDDYPIMQDLVSSGVMSDKGYPLICTPKENTFRINSPNPANANTQDKEALASSISFSKPILRLHYKIHSHQKDNLPIYRIKIQDNIIESHTNSPLDSLSIDIAKDTKALDDTQSLDSNLQDILSSIYTSLKDTYAKDYKYHYLSLQLDSNALILILLIPQRIPKVYKEPYKNYEFKDYGIGKYHYLYNYCTHTMLDIQDYTQVGLESNPSNATILTLHTPYKAQKLEIALANGLDSLIESKDREQNLDSLLTLTLINGGYKEKYWSFGEEVEEETEEKIDISQGILIASNDDTLAYELAFGERNDTIQIFNKKGIYLFSIERKGITETRLTVRQLYNKGIQWFESSAENYHKLLDVNPDLQDKTKCKGLGVLYFTWRDIVEFAEVDRFSSSFQSGGSGDWKQSPKGARGFILVSMEGIPYWADAVGQIPYAIGVYRNLLSYAGPKDAKRGVIDNKYYFYDGDPIKGKMRQIGILSIPKDELADNYDNKMVDRGLNFAIRKYKIKEKRVYPTHNEWIFIDLKPNPSLLALDSDGREVYA